MVAPGHQIVDRTEGRTGVRTSRSVELGSELGAELPLPKADLHECSKFGLRGPMWVVFVVDLHGSILLNTSGCFNSCFEGFFMVNSSIPANLDTTARGDLFFATFLIKCNVLG